MQMSTMLNNEVQLKKRLTEVFNLHKQGDCELKFSDMGFCAYESNFEDKSTPPVIHMDVTAEGEYEMFNFLKKKMDLECSIEESFEITLMHEIGHSRDQNLFHTKKIIRENRMKLLTSKTELDWDNRFNLMLEAILLKERAAWDFAIENAQEHLISDTILMSKYCLGLYKNETRSEMQRYFNPNKLTLTA